MAVHDKFAALAERLIEKHGRPMTLRKLSRTPADSAKPWRGPTTVTSTGYEAETDVKAVMVDYDETEIDGTNIKRGDKRLLVAAKPTPAADLTKYDSLLDGTQLFGIIKGNVIEPGTTRILYDFQVRQ